MRKYAKTSTIVIEDDDDEEEASGETDVTGVDDDFQEPLPSKPKAKGKVKVEPPVKTEPSHDDKPKGKKQTKRRRKPITWPTDPLDSVPLNR